MSRHLPLSLPFPAHIHRQDHTLTAKRLGYFRDQLRPLHRRRIQTHLVRPGPQKFPRILYRPHPSANGQGQKNLLCCFFYRLQKNGSCVTRGRNIEKNQFIRPLLVVGPSTLRRISCVPNRDKLHSFYHPPSIHIQTRNNSLRIHHSSKVGRVWALILWKRRIWILP